MVLFTVTKHNTNHSELTRYKIWMIYTSYKIIVRTSHLLGR